ncbi:MAG: SGNH/GDSL hydrolase family protein [Verrucomicrobiota bacterium]
MMMFAGCSTQFPVTSAKNFQSGESMVLVGENPAQLAFPPLRHKPLSVRNTYRDSPPRTIHYEAGRDFVIDYERGQIRRTAQSRIPDFRTNLLFGIEDFDHGKFPGFGNNNFFVFIDYATKNKIDWLKKQPSQVEFLSKTREKLQRGDNLKMIAFGDSITAGGEATEPNLIFWQRWADMLQQKYPRAKIEAINGATGGDRTGEGLARLQEKVLNRSPDLVLIGFGMNDHNVAGFGTPFVTFTNNLATMIDRIRKETSAEIILYSTFPPNPKWHYGSHNMEAYALATEQLAREKRCAFADVYHNWLALESKKKPEDLLANNINHPNDFGHWIYFAVLNVIGL